MSLYTEPRSNEDGSPHQERPFVHPDGEWSRFVCPDCRNTIDRFVEVGLLVGRTAPSCYSCATDEMVLLDGVRAEWHIRTAESLMKRCDFPNDRSRRNEEYALESRSRNSDWNAP